MGYLTSLAAAFSLMFASPLAPTTVKDPVPAEYQEGASIVVVVFAEDRYMVEGLCGDFDPLWITYACYYDEKLTGEGKDYIVSPNPCHYPEAKDYYSYAHLMCHEKAHKNGWKHPQ